MLTAGVGRDRLAYKSLKVLADQDPAVADVVGFTRYLIEGDPDGDATISIIGIRQWLSNWSLRA